MCEALQGLGFRRGSYKCVCRKGYYFPDILSLHKYFNGSLLEEEYEKLMLGKNSTYNIVNEYECLPCAEGCDSCEDGSPCIAALNWPMRTSILALACIVIGLLPPAAWFTFRYQQVKVVRAASPALLRVIALGAFFIYCTNIVMYPNPNLYTCTARIWLREIGFSLTYGALMLKTWRISVIFRVRSAKAVKITDAALLKRLGCICGAIGTCLLVRTLVSPPDVVVGRTADDLKAFLCKTDWWDYTFTSMEVVFLAWGVRLCIMVRKAPSEFNESRFISMAIYNEFLLTCFLNVSMLFLQSPANPDLLYIIFFCHTQLTVTLLLALIFGSKVYIVLRSGKSHQESIGMGAKSSGAKFNFRPQVRTFANPSSVTTSTVPVAATTSAENKLSDQEALEEIKQLSMQLQRIQEMAPPKGVAVMTISSLLDGLKTPGGMAMVAAAAGAGGGGNQLTVRPHKPEALPLLSLNSEMQKYNQQRQQNTPTPTSAAAMTNNNIVAMPMQSHGNIIEPSTKVIVTAQEPPTSPGKLVETTTRKPAANKQEKAINTEMTGNCLAKEDQQQHIICSECYKQCKEHYIKAHATSSHGTSTKLSKCELVGSPPHEGSLSFKNIKLDCMCSQSDDLDQIAESEQKAKTHTQAARLTTKRTAATNTPPCSMRKLYGKQQEHLKDAKLLSTASLPEDEASLAATAKARATKVKDDSHHHHHHHQITYQVCDNCKNKFNKKSKSNKNAAATKTIAATHHRKLSRLSSKTNKLPKYSEEPTGSAAAVKVAAAAASKTEDDSTDDIIFYTTTDTNSSSSDSDSETNDDDDDDDGSDKNSSSSLSQSKSESKAKVKGINLQELETKIISYSLGNINTKPQESGQTTATATASSALAKTKSKTKNSKNALLDKKKLTDSNATVSTTASKATASTSTSTTKKKEELPPCQPAAAASNPSSANGSSSVNGKAKQRPDKLVLDLNDRSKFTKEVSV